jgi:hypothetical protein
MPKKARAEIAVKPESTPSTSFYVVETGNIQKGMQVGTTVFSNPFEMVTSPSSKPADRATKAAKNLDSQPPLPVMLERLGDSTSILSHAGGIVLSESDFQTVESKIGSNVDTIALIATREFTPGSFQFTKLKKTIALRLVAPNTMLTPQAQAELYWNWEKKRWEFYVGKESGKPAVPAFNSELLNGVSLFRFGSNRPLIATEEFKTKIEQEKFTGIQFHRFDAQILGAVTTPKISPMASPMPPYPTFQLPNDWNAAVGEHWELTWNWLTKAFVHRGWPAKEFVRKPAVSMSKLNSLEKKQSITLPPICRSVFLNYAAKVVLDYGYVEATDPKYQSLVAVKEKASGLMFGGSITLWDFEALSETAEVQSWLEEVQGLPKAKRNCAPILIVRNGDMVTVDLETEEIRYWSHDGDDKLNRRLATNMIEFITRWSYLGTPWIDFIPGTCFYDTKAKQLHSKENAGVRAWHQWLAGIDP